MRRNSTTDYYLFPIELALALVILVAITLALFRAGYLLWAAVAAIASLLAALALGGWLVAGPYLEANIVVAIRARGGQMSKRRFAASDSSIDDRLLRHLSRKGVITVGDDTIFLHEEKIGRVLAFFIRMRMA
jgi:membrane protein implicated in regulation of membrane protease activity